MARLSARRLIEITMGAVGPFLGLIAVLALFTFLTKDVYFSKDYPWLRQDRNPKYLTAANIKTVAVQTAIIGTCGIGMTIVIIGGGIDLSVGSGIAFVTVVTALVFNGAFFPTVVDVVFLGSQKAGIAAVAVAVLITVAGLWRTQRDWRIAMLFPFLVVLGSLAFAGKGGFAAVFAGAITGLCCGVMNGLLVTTTRVVPFIVTLGSMEIFRGAAQLLAREQLVGVDRAAREQHGWFFQLMQSPPNPPQLILAIGVWIMVIAGLLVVILLNRTALGRYMFAIGSNEEAARLSGIAVSRVKLWIYSLAGALMGLAGVMQFSRLSTGDPTAAGGLELDVVAAVVIGGGSLRGGEGSILGTFVGAFIMGFMRNGCDLAGIPNSVQRVLIGAIIVLAVAIDERRHRRLL